MIICDGSGFNIEIKIPKDRDKNHLHTNLIVLYFRHMKTNKILDNQCVNVLSILDIQEKINNMMVNGKEINNAQSGAMVEFLISHLRATVVLMKGKNF